MFTALPVWATALLLLVGIGLLALIVLTVMASNGLDDVDETHATPCADCAQDPCECDEWNGFRPG